MDTYNILLLGTSGNLLYLSGIHCHISLVFHLMFELQMSHGFLHLAQALTHNIKTLRFTGVKPSTEHCCHPPVSPKAGLSNSECNPEL